MTFAIGLAIAAATALASWGTQRWFPRYNWSRPNHAGRLMPLGAGWTFLVAGAVGLWWWQAAGGSLAGSAADAAMRGQTLWLWVAGPLWLGALGWVDDRYGTSAHKGVAAHVRALAHGKPTTGALKLLGGGIFALAAALAADAPLTTSGAAAWVGVALDVLLVGLAINGVNAFDLRPGRAVKGWLLALLVAVAAGAVPVRAWPYLVAVAVYSVWDFRGRAMMGDTGSNSLGALAGLSLLAIPFWGVRLVLLAALVGFHLWMERHSLTTWIERHPAVRWFDHLGRPTA